MKTPAPLGPANLWDDTKGLKMKNKNSQQTEENFKAIMGTMSEEKIISNMIDALEASTGLKATQPQREYIDSIIRQKAMQWANVISGVQASMDDPEVAAKFKHQVNNGK
jgi:hypothetical protein